MPKLNKRDLALVPSNLSGPYFGTALTLTRDSLGFVRRSQAKYGNVFKSRFKACLYSYAPFGAGPHHCLGSAFAEMEMKSVMFHMLTKFEWALDEGYQIDMQQVPI